MADAELVCRTYYYWSGSSRCWRRTCWQVPDRRESYAAAAQYRYWNETDSSDTGYRVDDDDADDSDTESSSRNLFDEVDDPPEPTRRPQHWSAPDTEWWHDDKPAPKRYTQPTPPRVDPEQIIAGFFILCIVAGVFLLVRFIAWLSAVAQQRRLDKIERRVLSASTLTDRLQKDAREADALIRAYSREAFRRGSNY
jgi:hypothetical protein